MSIEKLCDRIGIKGLVNYGESETYLSVSQHGIEYAYNKKTNTLMVIYQDGSHLNIKNFAWAITLKQKPNKVLKK